MIRNSIVDCIGGTPLVRLDRLFPGREVEVIAKLDAFNPNGSSTDRPARHIIEQGLRDGAFTADTRLVESTSGETGVGLATVAKIYDLPFTAVVDPHVTPANLAIMRLLGATVDIVTGAGGPGDFVQGRIDRVHEILRADPRSRWINQYANALNPEAHFHTTAREIADAVDGRLDVLVAAVHTGGTIMGAARRLRATFPAMAVVGVAMVGSTVFGGPPGEQQLPGSKRGPRPELLELAEIDRVVHVTEAETVAGCRRLMSQEAILAGPSSGSVIAAVHRILPSLPRPVRIAIVLPDGGERYLQEIVGPVGPDVPI